MPTLSAFNPRKRIARAIREVCFGLRVHNGHNILVFDCASAPTRAKKDMIEDYFFRRPHQTRCTMAYMLSPDMKSGHDGITRHPEAEISHVFVFCRLCPPHPKGAERPLHSVIAASYWGEQIQKGLSLKLDLIG